MKNYYLKIFSIAILVLVLLKGVQKDNTYIETRALNIEFQSYNDIVYEDLNFALLSYKLNNYLHSLLTGYGEYIATHSLEVGVDPVVATSIILVETGCYTSCSYLVRHNNNVGGMRSNNGYMSFNSLEEGIDSFINNLAYNYYRKGLTTPKAMNSKYAENQNWYKDVNYYVTLIKAS